jgi:hypothetical protein
MILNKTVLSMVAAFSLTDLYVPLELQHTIEYSDCQQESFDNTMDYNYITTEKWIKNNIKKYLEILP